MNTTIVDQNKILDSKSLNNELDFERASIIDRKLRVLIKDYPELTEKDRNCVPYFMIMKIGFG